MRGPVESIAGCVVQALMISPKGLWVFRQCEAALGLTAVHNLCFGSYTTPSCLMRQERILHLEAEIEEK
jgi:hypothetical protein